MRIRKDNKAKLNNAGMTLVEILIAMAILSVAVIPLLFAFVNSFKYSIRGREVQQTTALAQTILENCKAYSPETVRTQMGADNGFLSGLTAANVYDPGNDFSVGNTFYMQDVPLENQLYDITLEITPRSINNPTGSTSYMMMDTLSMNPYLDAVFMPTNAVYTDPTTGVTHTAADLESEVYKIALQRIADGIEAETEAELGVGNGEILSLNYIEDSFKTGANAKNLKLYRDTQIVISNANDEVHVGITFSFELDGGKYYYDGVDLAGDPKTYEWVTAKTTIGTYDFLIYSNNYGDGDTHGAELLNIYFFYYPVYTYDYFTFYPFVSDEFVITNYSANSTKKINLYMIKQKNPDYTDMTELQTLEFYYSPKISAGASGHANTINVYHNFLDNLGTDIVGGVMKPDDSGIVQLVVDNGLVEDPSWFSGVTSMGSMYKEESKTLMYDVIVTLYDAGAYDPSTHSIISGSDAVLTMEGTTLDW